ncbi:MAG: exodeoxyribonuclease VII large subunit [Bacteroidetes bacterium]|nr:exodeoxyribonuclease VII large subunit [Bacteroidota bacterium]
MPEQTDKQVFTVGQLTRRIKGTLEDLFGTVTVSGEISNFVRHSSGHWYFTLKDASAQLSAVMFRGNAMGTFFRPQNGMEVVCRGRITVYEPRGNYQIVVSDMQPRGEGALQMAFEQLKHRLHAEGLFDESRKRPLPLYPDVIAIVTSPTGAAIRDMISVIRRRNPATRLLLVPVPVQGAGAAEQIAEAIDLCNRHGEADLIITGRGGGSIEDLWAFNEEIVARAIVRSGIPVVSAVGHEVDFTIADFVADVRAATPSVAGELVVRTRTEMLEQLKGIAFSAGKFVDFRMRARRQRLGSLLADRAFSRLDGRLQAALQLLDDRSERLQRGVDRVMERRGHQVGLLREKLAAHDPERFFRRGAALLSVEGQPVTGIGQLREGVSISVRLRDGAVTATVDRLEKQQVKDNTQTPEHA